MLGLENFNEISGHRWRSYRTSAGAEIDLVLDLPKAGRWAIEIKRSLAPKPEKGFHIACDDVKPDQRFVVYPGKGRYPASAGVEVIGLREMMGEMMGGLAG